MDEVDSSPSWTFTRGSEELWPQRQCHIDPPTAHLNPNLPGTGRMSHTSFTSSALLDSGLNSQPRFTSNSQPSFTSSAALESGFPSLQTSISSTTSFDSGYPSLQSSGVSLDSSFPSFHMSSSFNLDFSQKSTPGSIGSSVVSPDEGFDDVDSGPSLGPKDTVLNYLESEETALGNSSEYLQQTDLRVSQGYLHETAYGINQEHLQQMELGRSWGHMHEMLLNDETVLGSSCYPITSNTLSDVENIEPTGYLTIRPTELAVLLKAGFEKVNVLFGIP